MRVVLLWACCAALGCSEDPSNATGTGGSSGAAGAAAGGSDGGDSGPVISGVLVSGTLDADTKSVTLTVDVTDPDGLDDIVGGKLYTQNKAEFLGAFTQLSAGTFTQAVSWKALNEAEGVLFAKGTTITRSLLIEFTDTSQRSASVEQALELSCSGCGPECKACGVCTLGQCSICEPSLKWSTCDLFCASIAMTCVCAYATCGSATCIINGCGDPCPPSGCACGCT